MKKLLILSTVCVLLYGCTTVAKMTLTHPDGTSTSFTNEVSTKLAFPKRSQPNNSR